MYVIIFASRMVLFRLLMLSNCQDWLVGRSLSRVLLLLTCALFLALTPEDLFLDMHAFTVVVDIKVLFEINGHSAVLLRTLHVFWFCISHFCSRCVT